MSLPHPAPAIPRPDRPLARASTPHRARHLIGAAAGAVLCILAGGCTTGWFATKAARPSAPPAESCVARCELQRSQCQGRQATREKSCEENYARGKADHELCLTARTRRCLPPTPCLGADMRICDRQYDPCITDCGGPRALLPDAPPEDAQAEPVPVANVPLRSADSAPAVPAASAETATAPKPGQDQAAPAPVKPRVAAPKPAESAPK